MAMGQDPFSAFAASVGNGVGRGVGDAISGNGGGPMLSGGTTDARSGMDGSGWTVSTGGASATGGARTGAASLPGLGLATMAPAAQSNLLMLAALGLALIVVIRLTSQ